MRVWEDQNFGTTFSGNDSSTVSINAAGINVVLETRFSLSHDQKSFGAPESKNYWIIAVYRCLILVTERQPVFSKK